MMRRPTRQITVGGLPLGGDAPVRVQSMTNTPTQDVEATVGQIQALQQAGCELVRVAVPNKRAAEALPAIQERITIPLVADIHFSPTLALKAIEAGVDKLRINPGNIGSRDQVERVVRAAQERGIPIRIGVNAGSLESDLFQRYGGVTAEALVESALRHVAILEQLRFEDIMISLKASDVPLTIAAYQVMSAKVHYPLHLGITEAGTVRSGTIKSAVGMGAILAQGIGDTIRVSLTGDPVEEVWVGYEILKALGLRTHGPTLISCPTCGRTEIDLIPLAEKVECALQGIREPLKVAVMGCVVNGPGEAREADIGIAGGRGMGLFFRHGEVVRTVKEEELFEVLMEEVKREIDRSSASTYKGARA